MKFTYNKKSPSESNKQRGFSLVELLVAVTIAGILGAGYVSMTAGKSDNIKAGSQADEVLDSVNGIALRYSTGAAAATRYNGATFANSATALTENIRNSVITNVLTLEWGTVTFNSSSVAGVASGSTHQLWTFTNFPRAQCEIFLTKLAVTSQLILTGATGTTSVRSRITNDTLSAADIATVCPNDAANNTFRAVFS